MYSLSRKPRRVHHTRSPNSIPIIVNHLGRTVIIGKRQEQAAAVKAEAASYQQPALFDLGSKLAVYR